MRVFYLFYLFFLFLFFTLIDMSVDDRTKRNWRQMLFHSLGFFCRYHDLALATRVSEVTSLCICLCRFLRQGFSARWFQDSGGSARKQGTQDFFIWTPIGRLILHDCNTQNNCKMHAAKSCLIRRDFVTFLHVLLCVSDHCLFSLRFVVLCCLAAAMRSPPALPSVRFARDAGAGDSRGRY